MIRTCFWLRNSRRSLSDPRRCVIRVSPQTAVWGSDDHLPTADAPFRRANVRIADNASHYQANSLVSSNPSSRSCCRYRKARWTCTLVLYQHLNHLNHLQPSIVLKPFLNLSLLLPLFLLKFTSESCEGLWL